MKLSKSTNNTIHIPFQELFTSYLNEFLNNLEESRYCINKIFIEKIQNCLCYALSEISYKTFIKEFNEFKSENAKDNGSDQNDLYYNKFISNNLLDELKHLKLKYPVLFFNLRIRAITFSNFVKKLLNRFDSDRTDINSFLNINNSNITDIVFNNSDRHYGEEVVIIELNYKYKIVYKPRNISITVAHNNFLKWINHRLNLRLKLYNCIDKGDYGWLEFVYYCGCANYKNVKKYFFNAGILNALTYFFKSSDCHFENVISSGDSPVLIDLETILGNELIYSNQKDNERHSVTESLLIPSFKNKKNNVKAGFGSYFNINDCKVSNKIINCNQDDMKTVPFLIEINSSKLNMPKLDDKIQFAKNFKKHYINGFTLIYNFFLVNKKFLISDQSPINYYKNIEIRHIIRSTASYSIILTLLQEPQYLTNFKSYLNKLNSLPPILQSNEIYKKIQYHENMHLLVGDIPFFKANTSSTKLFLNSNENVPFFKHSAVNNVKKNIKSCSRKKLENQVKILKICLEL